MAERPYRKVLIVGAGPAGLLLALLLSKHGIPVSIIEMSHQLDQQPRAAHYGPAAIPDLKRAGILDQLRTKGLSLNTMCWRRFEDHSYIAGFDAGVISDVDGDDWRTVSYPLQDLDQLMLDEFLTKYNGEIKWLHKVLDVGQDVDKAWVDVETPEGKSRLEADYIVGCDGANSAVRKALFGPEYPGFTWDAQIIATNVCIVSSGCKAGKSLLGNADSDDTRHIMTLKENLDFLTPTLLFIQSTFLYVLSTVQLHQQRIEY